MMELAMHLKVRMFCEEVLKQLKTSNTAILYGDKWKDMPIVEFRKQVLERLSGECKEPRFSPPDSYDGWTFYAKVDVPTMYDGHEVNDTDYLSEEDLV